MKSCMNCSVYISCDNKRKSFDFYCDKYKKIRQEDLFFSKKDKKVKEKDIEQPTQITSDINSKKEFNVEHVVSIALSDSTSAPVDVKINDSHIPRAKNFFEFATGEQFLNIKPYVEQMCIATILFAEFCPVCSKMEWLFEDHKVDDSLRRFEKRVALLHNGKCPHCHATKSKLVENKKLKFFQELAVSAGQRSGKSALVAMMSAYLTHRILKLQKPNEVYGLLHSNVLQGTFVALTYAQAKDTLWEPFFGYLNNAPWFVQYNQFMHEQSMKYGEELIKLNETAVVYRHRSLMVYPAGPDKRTLRGRTRCFASIDELGWFDSEADSKKIKMNANEIYVALERSLLTVRASANKLIKKGFNDIPSGYFLNISSPSSVRDKIMELVRKSENSTKIYGLIKPTWEMNPTVSYEDLEEEFKKDEVTAWRDYGARPPLSSNAFIQAIDVVERAITSKKNGASVQYATKTYGEDTFRYGKITNIKKVYQKSILALDAGMTNNSFACVSGYLDDESNFVVSTAIEIMPHPGSPVNFTLIYKNIISKIVEYQNVVLVVADRWNSAKFLSDLREDLGIATEQYSMKYADFWFVRDMLFSNNILLPEPTKEVKDCIIYDMDEYPLCYENNPINHLVLQILTVRDTGNAITKGDGGLTDDLFRALALAVHRRHNEKAADLFEGEEEEEVEFPPFMAIARRIPSESSLTRRQIINTDGKAIAIGRKSRG